MGAKTGISWTRSTRNFWSGCTKVGPGCDGCYAEASSRRMRGLDELTKEAANWGAGRPRIPHLKNAEFDVRKWNALCEIEKQGGKMVKVPKDQRQPGQPHKIHVTCFSGGWAHPGFWPVFINSYSDTFDNEVDQAWRDVLFKTIEDCPHLIFQLVTKRVGNVLPMLGGRWDGRFPRNVWLIATVVTEDELRRDGPKLLAISEQLHPTVIGLSMEPQIERLDVAWFLDRACQLEQTVWGIQGGESAQPGHHPVVGGVPVPARPFELNWAIEMADEFAVQGHPYFFKQAGSNVSLGGIPYAVTGKGDDPVEWPGRLQSRQFAMWDEAAQAWMVA